MRIKIDINRCRVKSINTSRHVTRNNWKIERIISKRRNSRKYSSYITNSTTLVEIKINRVKYSVESVKKNHRGKRLGDTLNN